MLYVPPSIRGFEPRRFTPPRSDAHMAFEYDLASALRPRLAVDLGAGDGSAFLGYCQAACDRGFELWCYAADEWKTRSREGAPTFNELRDFVRRHYMGLVTLVESPPEGLLAHFHPGSVDLLRLDGSLPLDPSQVPPWLERTSARGVVVVDGIDSEQSRRLWDAARAGRVGFELSGLGVAVPADGPADGLVALLRDTAGHEDLVRFYQHAGFYHEIRRQTDPARVLAR